MSPTTSNSGRGTIYFSALAVSANLFLGAERHPLSESPMWINGARSLASQTEGSAIYRRRGGGKGGLFDEHRRDGDKIGLPRYLAADTTFGIGS